MTAFLQELVIHAELIVDWALDQDSALDELGRYNVNRYDVHKTFHLKVSMILYEFNEVGMRTIDDLRYLWCCY